MNNVKISYKRHLAKTISYRLLSSGIGFLFMWWATDNVKIGLTLSVAELVYKPIQYYLHERIWYRWIKFGVIKNLEKKKKNSILTEDKIEELNNQIPKTEPPPPNSPVKKILNYNSNR